MCPWDGYAPATIAFCERRLCAWVVEPSNAWSNVAYVLAGLFVLWRCAPWRSTARWAIGVAAIVLGLGSFTFHATGIRVFEVLDVSGMYLLSAIGLGFAGRRLFGWRDDTVVASIAAVALTSSVLMVVLGNDGIAVFGIEMLLIIASELHLRARNPPGVGVWLLRTVVALVVALGIWVLDIRGPLCDPDNHLLTGHAVWHVLTALAILLYDRYEEGLELGAGTGVDVVTTVSRRLG
jgi:hypothetical protein